jgi:hypothetical protein
MSLRESHARSVEEIFRSDTAIVTREAGFIRLRRTSLGLARAGLHVVPDFVDEFRLLVPLRERRNLGLLLDSREAPMIGDDLMFHAMRPMVADMVVGFARVAILVQTAVGKLQATRRSREGDFFGSDPVAVFSDEAQAIAHVIGRKA